MRKLNIFLLCVLVVALLVAGKLYTEPPKEPIKQETQEVQTPPEFVVDPYIIQLGQEVGISQETLVKLKARFVDSCSSMPQTLACYNGQMTLTNEIKNKDRYKQRVAITHEYLHYIWHNNQGMHDSVKPQLLRVYQANKAYFDARFVNYYNNGMKMGSEEFYNELHSFVGTEVSDSKLTPGLLDHYSKYTNRSALPSYI